jgi:predicted transcriptional regulator
MNTNFKTVNSHDNLDKIYKLTHREKHPFFPVLKNNKLVGAIDQINLNAQGTLQSATPLVTPRWYPSSRTRRASTS